MAEETPERRAERLQLEEICGGIARMLQKAINESAEPGQRLGFALLMFDFGEEGSFAYAANAQRADVLKLLREAEEKIRTNTQ